MQGAPTIQLYRSNRIELLAEQLAELLSAPVGGPFDDEWIVVPSRGMEVWLRTELARRHGVWAGGALLFPRHFLECLFRIVLREPNVEAYRRERLFWSLMRALGEADVPRPSNMARMARALAETFDQYAIYRPEMLRAWDAGDAGGEEGWQAKLWRAVTARMGPSHAAALEARLLAALDE